MDFIFLFAIFITPIGMFLVGVWWKVSPPPYQKNGLSYNTELTRANPDAWFAAHKHCSRLWIRISIISTLVSGILIWLFPENYLDFWMWLIVGQMVLFCISVFMVDLLLKHQFGEDDKK